MNDPSFVFTFQVLISNPESAFEPDGKLRVFFGGFNDDLQGTGPNNYEVSGAMRLNATALPIIPDPVTAGLVGLSGVGLALVGLRRRRAD
jgi:hypothetical protein